MDKQMIKDILLDLVEKNQKDIDDLLSINMILEMVSSDEMLKWSMLNIRMSDVIVQRIVKDKFARDGNYDFLIDVMSSISLEDEQDFILRNILKSITQHIPLKYLVNKENIEKILENNPKKILHFQHEVLDRCLKEDWFIDCCINNKICISDIASTGQSIPSINKDVNKAKKIITNNIVDLKFLNENMLGSLEIINLGLDLMNNYFKIDKRKKGDKNPYIMKIVLGLGMSLVNGVENIKKSTFNDKKMVASIKNEMFIDAFAEIGILFDNYEEKHLLTVLEKRNLLIRKINPVYSVNHDYFKLILLDIDLKNVNNKLLVNILEHYSSFLKLSKGENVDSSSPKKLVEIFKKYNSENFNIKDIVDTFDRRVWKSSSTLLTERDVDKLILDVNKLKIILLEDDLLINSPKSTLPANKTNTRKF